jgi:hypothetical protein
MLDKNYYEILGTTPSASEKTLKEQFRKLMKLYHPDVNKRPDAAMRYAQIMEAYRTLSDKSARAMYDLSNNFAGASYGASSSAASSDDSPPPRKETLESRKEHYERLLREKRAREQMQKDGAFSPVTYLLRWRVWLMIPASSLAIAALSIFLENSTSLSAGNTDIFAATGAAFALTLLMWLVYLIFRLSAAYLEYQPSKLVLGFWGLPTAYLYDVILGRSYGGAGYGDSFFMKIGNISFLPGFAFFFLIFGSVALFLEMKPRMRQVQRQGVNGAAAGTAVRTGRAASGKTQGKS